MRNTIRGGIPLTGNDQYLQEVEVRLGVVVDEFDALQKNYSSLETLSDNLVRGLISLKESIELPESDKGKKGFHFYLQEVYLLVNEYLKWKSTIKS